MWSSSPNSREQLEGALSPCSQWTTPAPPSSTNASSDGGVEALHRLPVAAIPRERNDGFAHGCNIGWRRLGSPPHARPGRRRGVYLAFSEDGTRRRRRPATSRSDGACHPCQCEGSYADRRG